MRRNGLDFRLWANASGRIIPQKYWKNTGQMCQGGEILGRLQEEAFMSGQDCRQLTLFPVDSPASPFLSPGSAEARRTTVTSGRKCLGLYKKSGPLGSLVRTLLVSSAWRSTRCFLTWKVSATPAKRLLFRLVPSMPRTGGTGARFWPTVCATEASQGLQIRRQGKKGSQISLSTAVKMWPLPSASDCGGTVINPHMTRNGTIRHIGKNGAQSYARLDAVATLFPTPKANAGTGASKSQNHQGGPDLQTVCGGTLNPTWVEWLMGFPIGWTDLDA